VSFTYPYKVLKPSNVLGTLDAIRLAYFDWFVESGIMPLPGSGVPL